MRLLVTGSRDWPHYRAVWAALNELAVACVETFDPELTVVHGDARGVDSFADSWARGLGPDLPDGLRVMREPHRVIPSEWRAYGNWAAHRRNAAMVRLGADVCFAFLWPCTKPLCRKPKPHRSHGASGCADLAEAADIRVQRFYSEPCSQCNGKGEIAAEMTSQGCRFERCPVCAPIEEMERG